MTLGKGFLYLSTTLTTRYNMTTDNQTVLTDENMRVRGDKRQRIKKVKREYAKAAERDMTDTGVLDEALDIGLSELERRLSITV